MVPFLSAVTMSRTPFMIATLLPLVKSTINLKMSTAKLVVDALQILHFHVTIFLFLIKSCKPSLKMTIEEIEVAKEAASMRQSSEWGMRGFRPSSFKFKIEFLWNTKDSENE